MKRTFSSSAIFCSVFLSAFATLLSTGCSNGGGGGGALATGGFAGGFTSDNLNLDITVSSIVIPSDFRPEVTFTVTDDAGDTVPPGELSDVRFILARLERMDVGSPFEYLSYITRIEDPDGVPNSGDEAIQADYDSARLSGVTQNSDDSYTYKFASALPANFDRSATHQLGGQFRRISAADGVTYRANLTLPFRPDGGAVTDRREIVDTQACNQCHTRLSVHGDIRREVQLCILCHNSGTTDAQTGNSLRFPELIHKIHRGADLPSVQSGENYQIIGFRNSVHDYSTVEFPQDIRDCSVCHDTAPQASIHEDAPTLAGCASCHDRTWFGAIDDTPPSFTNHIGGVHHNNNLCALCHAPQGNGVSLVDIAHIIPVESDAAPGLNFEITSVSTFAGSTDTAVQIAFTATDGIGNPEPDLSALDIVAATVSYPVPEYQTFIRETIASGFGGPDGTLMNQGGGAYLYTFDAELPTGSIDTFAVAMEGRREFTFRGETFDQGTSSNGQMLFTLDSSAPVGRRFVVDENKCNVCHKEVRMHGELRTGIELCVMCHNPNTTDEGQRPIADLPPVSVNFKELIHRIHTGENLEQDYTVYGFGERPHNFNEIRFPGDRRECTICHVPGTTSVPLPNEALSTLITEGSGPTVVSETLPTRAACISCHDDSAADTHALLNTDLVNKVESCTVCHSDSDVASVANVHMIEP